jgi:hypothetical protein
MQKLYINKIIFYLIILLFISINESVLSTNKTILWIQPPIKATIKVALGYLTINLKTAL